MHDFVQRMRRIWVVIIEQPWKTARYSRTTRWTGWFVGWLFALVGLLAGALIAPSLVNSAGLAGTVYEDGMLVAIAVLASFLLQVVGWGLLAVSLALTPHLPPDAPLWKRFLFRYRSAFFDLIFLCLGFLFLVYPLLTEVQTRQGATTIAFVGGLLVKILVIPLIQSAVVSPTLKKFLDWVRGKDQEDAPPQ